MSLQRRLTIFFVIIVILPLAAAGIIVLRIVTSEINKRAELALPAALDSVVVAFNERSSVIDERLRAAVDGERLAKLADAPSLQQYLSDRLSMTEGLDFVMFLSPTGEIRGAALHQPDLLEGLETPTPEEILANDGMGTSFVTARIDVVRAGGRRAGTLVGGFWLDRGILVGDGAGGIGLSIVSDGQMIASTTAMEGPQRVPLTFGSTFHAEIGQEVIAQARELAGGVSVVASIPAARADAASSSVLTSIVVLLLLALIGTTALAVLLARLITRPLDEVSEAAAAVSEGRFDRRIPVRSGDEVGRLAVAFNEMTDRLAITIGELQSSRDALRRSARRVGETLRSTHDMGQMLDSILNSAVDAVEADFGVLWNHAQARQELHPARSRGVDGSSLGVVPLGDGVVGAAAAADSAKKTPDPATGAPTPTANEPSAPYSIALPVHSESRVMAVLVVYRRSRPFGITDLETLSFLTEQADVAIENVLLHEEARRLSLTDGLTGVFNRRFFQMQFRQVIAQATRFERPFSVLMMDLDRFKSINDRYGHGRGDEILMEFSDRILSLLREVDTFARYGGEEFVCLLSETDRDGATVTAAKILEAVRSRPFGEEDGDQIAVTVSIGIASFPQHGDSFRTLVEAADRGLYRAKNEGRDRACTPDDGPSGLRLAT